MTEVGPLSDVAELGREVAGHKERIGGLEDWRDRHEKRHEGLEKWAERPTWIVTVLITVLSSLVVGLIVALLTRR